MERYPFKPNSVITAAGGTERLRQMNPQFRIMPSLNYDEIGAVLRDAPAGSNLVTTIPVYGVEREFGIWNLAISLRTISEHDTDYMTYLKARFASERGPHIRKVRENLLGTNNTPHTLFPEVVIDEIDPDTAEVQSYTSENPAVFNDIFNNGDQIDATTDRIVEHGVESRSPLRHVGSINGEQAMLFKHWFEEVEKVAIDVGFKGNLYYCPVQIGSDTERERAARRIMNLKRFGGTLANLKNEFNSVISNLGELMYLYRQNLEFTSSEVGRLFGIPEGAFDLSSLGPIDYGNQVFDVSRGEMFLGMENVDPFMKAGYRFMQELSCGSEDPITTIDTGEWYGLMLEHVFALGLIQAEHTRIGSAITRTQEDEFNHTAARVISSIEPSRIAEIMDTDYQKPALEVLSGIEEFSGFNLTIRLSRNRTTTARPRKKKRRAKKKKR